MPYRSTIIDIIKILYYLQVPFFFQFAGTLPNQSMFCTCGEKCKAFSEWRDLEGSKDQYVAVQLQQ